MRIKELAAITGVRKETIHYYTREKLLPGAVKTAETQSQYSQVHVDRIKLIKQLQERLFMPLSAIKKLLAEYEEQGLNPDQILADKIDHFDPFNELLEKEVRGEEEFLAVTGMAPERLAYLEEIRFFSPRLSGDEKYYSFTDVSTARIMGDLRRKGFTLEKGFRPDMVVDFKSMLAPLVELSMEELHRVARESGETEWFLNQKELFVQSVARLVQHLFTGMAREYEPKASDSE